MYEKVRDTYEELLKKHPQFEGVIHQKSWDYISESDLHTIDILKKLWCENLEQNIKSKRFKRHGGLDRDCIDFGKNKAIVGIGAGKSINRNKNILKKIHDIDGIRHPDDRNFIFIACNHMFKPLLKEGIIPDFVMVADGSDVVLDQLTVDIPESGRNCILLAGLHCSPKVLKRWEKQGRDIRFYLTMTPEVKQAYVDITNNDPERITIQQGGNVLNSCWTTAIKFFKSSVFMALGNDLSYELIEDDEQRRNNYYADGDYSTNLGTGRDEAERKEAWMGFKLSRTNIVSLDATRKYNIELEPVGTTANLWVYKTWLESNVLMWSEQKLVPFHYYNCSEGGIAGVMCRSEESIERNDIRNWFMLDEVCRRWRTRMFEDAIGEFLKAKDALRWGIQHDAQNATALAMRS